MSILDDDLDISRERLIKLVVLRYIHNSDYQYKNEVTMDNLFYDDGHARIDKFKDWYRMTIARLGFGGGYRVCWDAGIPARGWEGIVSDKYSVTLEEFLKEIGE